MGNSHTSVNDLPGMVEAMVRAARPNTTVAKVVAPDIMFLDERLHDEASVRLLRDGRWSFVVLQAQKYSTSGLFTYSTAEAEAWIRMTRAANAVPILFPEWPRDGIAETERIYDLHVSIARREPACVAPIGQAWDLARSRHPEVVLHASDGNHSAPAGAFLAALVLATTMTGTSPVQLPSFPEFPVDAVTQGKLRAIAAETVLAISPRQFCPADPFAPDENRDSPGFGQNSFHAARSRLARPFRPRRRDEEHHPRGGSEPHRAGSREPADRAARGSAGRGAPLPER
jgi:hypothetical protein